MRLTVWLLTCGLLMSGCTAAAGGAAVPTARGGGKADGLDPVIVPSEGPPFEASAIGRIEAFGARCTGVLIDPSTVLTSAACLPWSRREMDRALAYSETAFFELSDGSRRRIALVDHGVLSPDPERDRAGSGGTGLAEPGQPDLGLARLAEPVDGVPPLPLVEDVRGLDEVGVPSGAVPATVVSFTGDTDRPHRWAERELVWDDGEELDPVWVLRGESSYETCARDAGGVVLVSEGGAARVAGILHHTTTKSCSAHHHAVSSVAYAAERLSGLRARLEQRAEPYQVGPAEDRGARRTWLLLQRGYEGVGSQYTIEVAPEAQRVVVEIAAHGRESLFVGREPVSIFDLDRDADHELLPPEEERFLCARVDVTDRARCVIDVSDRPLDTLEVSVLNLARDSERDFGIAAWRE